MNTFIHIKATKNYGKIAYYPSCPQASIFAEMLQQSTLTVLDLVKIKKLGFDLMFSGDDVPHNDRILLQLKQA